MLSEKIAFPKIPRLEPCIPPRWAQTGHLQTLVGHFFPSNQLQEAGEKIVLSAPSKSSNVFGESNGQAASEKRRIDRLHVQFNENSHIDQLVAHFFPGDSSSVVYLFHGLGGDSHSAYMQRSALLARARGHSVFLFNHRGCGSGTGLSREPYHSGRAEDLSEMIRYGRERFPKHRHLAIGFSLSGNAVLLLAAKQRATVLPDAAIAVNAPIHLGKAAHLLTKGFSRVYDIDFMRQMRQSLKSRSRIDSRVSKINIPLSLTLRDFDNLYTAPFGGFKNREDYYDSCSAVNFLNQICIPTVSITAADDPFVAVEDYVNCRHSNQIHIHVESYGGHMGFYNAKSTPLGTRRWLDYALASYMDVLLH